MKNLGYSQSTKHRCEAYNYSYEADSNQTACAAQAILAIQSSESLICDRSSYSIEDKIIYVKMLQTLKGNFSAFLWLYIKEANKMSRA